MTVWMELMIACDLKKDSPQEVIDVLKYLTRKHDYEFANPPRHPFFYDEDGKEYAMWPYIFQPDSEEGFDLSRFPGSGLSNFNQANWDSELYKLTIRGNAGTQNGFEWNLSFLQWLALYVEADEYMLFSGYFRPTFSNTGIIHPTLIYFYDGKLYLAEAPQNPVEVTDENIADFF